MLLHHRLGILQTDRERELIGLLAVQLIVGADGDFVHIELEPRFERRHALTVRIIRLDGIIASTTAALHDMIAYAD
mgnify:CR=1 FL=1